MVLPPRKYRDFVRSIAEQVIAVSSTLSTDYYEQVFVPSGLCLEKIKVSSVNAERYRVLGEEHLNEVLRSFEPHNQGHVDPVIYDRVGTKTGRLRVLSGPKILTLPKDWRDLIVPRARSRVIAYVDLTALEATFVLNKSGRNNICEGDVYSYVSKEVFDGRLPRDSAKALVLSRLYGSSAASLAGKLSMSEEEAACVLSKVDTLMDIGTLSNKLWLEAQSGHIRNAFGRVLNVASGEAKHVVLNYYVQSSAVDVALTYFSELIEQLEKEIVDAEPLFVLHDALLLDVSLGSIERLEQLVAAWRSALGGLYRCKVTRLVVS